MYKNIRNYNLYLPQKLLFKPYYIIIKNQEIVKENFYFFAFRNNLIKLKSLIFWMTINLTAIILPYDMLMFM